MISVLDMLRSRLGGDNLPFSDMGGELGPSEADRRLRAMGPIPPSYLPEAVWDSLLNRPTYGEGQIMPGPPNPAMEAEIPARLGPQREDRLLRALGNVRGYGASGGVMTDTLPNSMFGNTSPAYPSPLNSMMRRAPLGLY